MIKMIDDKVSGIFLAIKRLSKQEQDKLFAFLYTYLQREGLLDEVVPYYRKGNSLVFTSLRNFVDEEHYPIHE